MALTSTKLQVVQKAEPRPQAKAATTAIVETDISANPIAKAVLDPVARDDQKVATLTRSITAETLKDVQSFAAYLAQRRTLAQRRLLELTSTTAFPRLQSVIGKLQGGVVDFDNMMQPMTDDLQAAFDLRTNGKMNEAMRQIDEDRKKEAIWETERKRIAETTLKIARDKDQLEVEIARLGLQKNWFGQVKQSALQSIAEKKLLIERLSQAKADLTRQEATIMQDEADHAARTDDYKVQKERLRKMLDLGSGYTQRVEAIVRKAIEFIDNSSSEVGAIRGEFDDLEDQATNVLRANAQMVRVTAILDKGIDGANQRHKDRAKELSVAPADEDTLASVTRTQDRNEIERFVSALSETSVSTKKNVSALQEDAVGANSFAQVVMRQQTNLRELHGDGIASITTNLNMALQSFNTAALTEAGNNAWQAIGDMNAVTNKIRDNEVVASAMQVDDTNQRIIDKFASLAGVSEALQEANKIRADGIANIATNLAELKQKTDEVQRNLQVNIGLDVAVPPPTEKTTTEDVGLMKI